MDALDYLKENSHQILKLAERKIQRPTSPCMKLTVQPSTEAENEPQVVQMIPRNTRIRYFVSSFASKFFRLSCAKCS